MTIYKWFLVEIDGEAERSLMSYFFIYPFHQIGLILEPKVVRGDRSLNVLIHICYSEQFDCIEFLPVIQLCGSANLQANIALQLPSNTTNDSVALIVLDFHHCCHYHDCVVSSVFPMMTNNFRPPAVFRLLDLRLIVYMRQRASNAIQLCEIIPVNRQNVRVQ